jgi:hypothetical protein
LNESFESKIETTISEMEPRAMTGDCDAMLILTTLHHDLAVRRLSWAHFETAESFLRHAADQGYAEAIERMKTWDVLRYALKKRIARSGVA